jgi:PHO85 cyclin-5
MNCSDDDSSPPYISSYREGPYNPSLASSASSSSASVWSVASQSSDDSSVHSTGVTSDAEISDSYCYTSQPSYQPITGVCERSATSTACWSKNILSTIAPQQRQHSRRTNAGIGTRSGCPPPLIRQCDRKVNFVDSLVGKLTIAIL